MKVGGNKLRAALYLTIAAGLVGLGLMPLLTGRALSPTMNHETCSTDGSVNDCSGPSADTTVVLKDEQTVPIRRPHDQPEPPPNVDYAPRNGYPAPKKPASFNLIGSLVLRPSDLVMRYANYRI